MSPAEEREKRYKAKQLCNQARKDALAGKPPVEPSNESYMQAYNWALVSQHKPMERDK